jgi:hypothetical protein
MKTGGISATLRFQVPESLVNLDQFCEINRIRPPLIQIHPATLDPTFWRLDRQCDDAARRVGREKRDGRARGSL